MLKNNNIKTDSISISLGMNITEWEVDKPHNVLEYIEEFEDFVPSEIQREILVSMFGIDAKKFQVNPEVIFLFAGQRAGKNEVIQVATRYCAFHLNEASSPQLLLGKLPGDTIDIINMSKTDKQAQDVFFKRFCDGLKGISGTPKARRLRKWWEDRGMNFSPKTGDILANTVKFPKNIIAHSLNSLSSSGEGHNIFLAIIDEIADFDWERADRCWKVITNNCKATFAGKGKVVIMSYPRHSDDYSVHLWEILQGQEPRVVVKRAKTWEMNPTVTRLSLEPAYQENPLDARCRYECIPYSSKDTYWRYPERLLEAYDSSCNFIVETQEHEVNRIIESTQNTKRFVANRIINTIIPNKPYEYFIFGDPGATRDSFALSMVHPEIDESDYSEQIRIVVDAIIEWKPKRDGYEEIPVDFLNVEDIIRELCSKFNVVMVRTDHWNSIQLNQSLMDSGIDAESVFFSNQTQLKMYDTWQKLVNTHLWKCPQHISMDYAIKLNLINGLKVSGKNKHIPDSLAGATYFAMESGIFSFKSDVQVIDLLKKPNDTINNDSTNTIGGD